MTMFIGGTLTWLGFMAFLYPHLFNITLPIHRFAKMGYPQIIHCTGNFPYNHPAFWYPPFMGNGNPYVCVYIYIYM